MHYVQDLCYIDTRCPLNFLFKDFSNLVFFFSVKEKNKAHRVKQTIE